LSQIDRIAGVGAGNEEQAAVPLGCRTSGGSRKKRAAQYAALEATAVDIDDEEALDAVLEELREARRTVAKRRRQGSE
jgi:hypothetical protein